ncbi:MAG TPA: hypothetical protein VKV17_00945 [Bryobacteraceae bacterium]|nr:hypothetical protein [Bryobacteraceae bacterium]
MEERHDDSLESRLRQEMEILARIDDLKPENIMLQRLSGGGEAVKLIDFGIAKVGADRLRVIGGPAGHPGGAGIGG